MTCVTKQLPIENVELLEDPNDPPLILLKLANAMFSVFGVLLVVDVGSTSWATNTSPSLTVLWPLRVLMVDPEIPRTESLHSPPPLLIASDPKLETVRELPVPVTATTATSQLSGAFSGIVTSI
jgi:hypothetical protein